MISVEQFFSYNLKKITQKQLEDKTQDDNTDNKVLVIMSISPTKWPWLSNNNAIFRY